MSAARRCSGVRNSRTSRSGSAEIGASASIIASARAPSAAGSSVSHFRSTTVSSMPSTLIRTCSRMVSMVEPLAQRSQPSISPNTKICAMTYQSYWRWMSAQSSEVTTMTGQASRGVRSQPRNRKPRNRISSPIGVNDDDGDPEPEQPAGRACGGVDVDLERRDQIAPEHQAQRVADRRSWRPWRQGRTAIRRGAAKSARGNRRH